jgi:hypothetical protein
LVGSLSGSSREISLLFYQNTAKTTRPSTSYLAWCLSSSYASMK